MKNSPPTDSLPERFQARLSPLQPQHERYAVDVVNAVLELAEQELASDIHWLPLPTGGLRCLFRVNGVLVEVGTIPQAGPNIVARLKVLANLLTYRTDIPQEGRIRNEQRAEMRISTFPTIHGEKAVVRLFIGSGNYKTLEQLQYPAEILSGLRELIQKTSGLLVVCGPAGSGKTTTLYAALREIQAQAGVGRSLCTLEDPIEALIPGVSQSQIQPKSDFNYHTGLASLMRQDPEVIMVGEIRDQLTGRIAFQASLTGHLVLTSFHAGDAADAISRLSDMDIEPYVLRSGLIGIIAQRLMRQLCDCARVDDLSPGCEACRHTLYNGRFVVAELLRPDFKNLGRAILDQTDADQIAAYAQAAGMVSLVDRAREAVVARRTTLGEFHRLFGVDESGPQVENR